jgi:hypothetical protein
MAFNAGRAERRFVDIYNREVAEIQRKLLAYAERLVKPGGPGTMMEDIPPRPDLQVTVQEGFPVMPPLTFGVTQNKRELEDLLRSYLTEHYSEQ